MLVGFCQLNTNLDTSGKMESWENASTTLVMRQVYGANVWITDWCERAQVTGRVAITGQVVLDGLRKQIQQASKQHSSVLVAASSSVPRVPPWLPLVMACDLRVRRRNKSLSSQAAFAHGIVTATETFVTTYANLRRVAILKWRFQHGGKRQVNWLWHQYWTVLYM